MAKYTLGRWKVSRGPLSGRPCVMAETVSQETWICGQFLNYPDLSNEFTVGEEEALANARLTAASPDMYEALKDCAAHPDWTVEQMNARCAPAVAKAEGKQ